MRFEWTPEGYARVVAQGLDPAEVNAALAGPGQRLLRQVDDDTLSVLVRTATGTLIEVWLTEADSDSARELFAAFDAGLVGHAKWRNAFGQEES